MAGFGRVASRVYALFTRNPSTAAAVIELAALRPGDRLLEVGVGAGGALDLAARAIGADQVCGIDPSPTFAEIVARRVPGATVRTAGAESVPFPDGSFSVILSIASLHHWDDRAAGLASVTAKLVPGGRLLLAERRLARPGHGITADGIAVVEQELVELGQTGVHTVDQPAGHRRLAVITSYRPLTD